MSNHPFISLLILSLSLISTISIPFYGLNIYWHQNTEYQLVKDGVYPFHNNQSISDYDAILALGVYNNNTIPLKYILSFDSNNNIWSTEYPYPSGTINGKSNIDIPILFHCNNLTGYASANVQFDITGYDTVKIPIFKNCIAGGIQSQLQISKAVLKYDKIVVNGVTVKSYDSNTPLSELPIFPYSETDVFSIYVTSGSQYINLSVDDDSLSNTYISAGSYLVLTNTLSYFEVSYRFVSSAQYSKSLVSVTIEPGSFGPITFSYYKTMQSSDNNRGLSTSVIVIIFIFVSLLLFNLWGSIYKYVYMNARGWDMVLFIDDYRAIYNKCAGVEEYKPVKHQYNEPLNHLSTNEPAPHIVAKSNPFASYQQL